MTDFPAIRRLGRMFTWMAVLGGAIVVLGLVLGIVMEVWAEAIALLGAGAVVLFGGIYGRYRGFRLLEQLRQRGK